MQKLVIVFTLATLLGACSSTRQSEIESEASSIARDALPEMREAWRGASAAGAVQIGWISAFNDPLLDGLVVEAVSHNLDLQVAAANVERARALARQAGANLAPAVNLSGGGGRTGSLDSGSGNATSLNVGLQVSWEADLWGRIRAGTAQASLSAEAAEADYQFAQYSIAANTAIAYFAAIEANNQTKTAEKNLMILQKTLKIVQARYTEGMSSAQDLALTRSDIASAKERVEALKNAYVNALRSLELLLGRYPGAEISIREDLPQLPPAPPVGLPGELLERRPDIVAAERRIAAAFNAVDKAKAAKLPSLSLTGSLGGASGDLSNLLDPANAAWSLGSNLLAPLFDGGARQESVNIATAEQKAAVAQYVDAALSAFGDVESGLELSESLRLRLESLEEASAQAAEAYRLAEILHKEGESSLLDLLAVQQRLISAESNVISLQRALLGQRVALNLALGGEW